MTELGIEWYYEHEAFALPSGNYLPDFWLPNLQITRSAASTGCFMEIKGQQPCGEEDRLMDELAERTNIPLVCFVGTPAEYARRTLKDLQFGGEPYLHLGVGRGDTGYCWTICPTCRVLGIEFEGRSARLNHVRGCAIINEDRAYNYNDSKLLAAVEKSKQWRSPEGG